MFADRGRAEEFLERVKREILSKGRIEFGTDRALHGDAMRAAAMVREWVAERESDDGDVGTVAVSKCARVSGGPV